MGDILRKIFVIFALLCSLAAQGQIKSLVCGQASFTAAGSTSCTIALSSALSQNSAPYGNISLTSSSSAVSIPSHISTPTGALSATFTANASAVTTAQTVTLTAFINTSTPTPQRFTITLSPPGATTGASPFTTSATAVAFGPVTIGQSGQSTVSITFTPTAAQAYSGTITIPVTGTGVAPVTTAHSVSLSWGAPASTPEPIVGYEVTRNDGQSFSSPIASYVDTAVVAGATYSYFVESLGADGNLSVPSNTAQAVIP